MVVSDLSILWLLQAFVVGMQGSNKNVHIVPVTINYERIFEMKNLANEMVSGKSNYNLLKIHQMIKTDEQGRLGKSFVIFGKPISLKDYIAKEGFKTLDATNINEAGLRLSERLL